jgi:hypothetical protein
LILKSNHFKVSNDDYINYESYGVSLKSKVFESKIRKGKKNARLEFSNGIIFNYDDGKFNATLDGDYLDINGKYLIQSYLGVIKLSYSPKSGEIWWVFEPKK